MSLTSRESRQTQVRRLSLTECWTFMASHREGRLGYRTGRGKRCVVVRYAIAGDQIVFRLPDYNDIAQYAPNERVTLEVEGSQVGGGFDTVYVAGTAQVSGDPSALVDDTLDEEWPDGVATKTLSLRASAMNGEHRHPQERP